MDVGGERDVSGAVGGAGGAVDDLPSLIGNSRVPVGYYIGGVRSYGGTLSSGGALSSSGGCGGRKDGHHDK